MNSSELSYFAGFFDGEGCVGVTNRIPPHSALFIRTQVVNTNLEVLEQMKRAFGGSIQIRKAKLNWQQMYTWQCTTQVAYHFLKQILPYLRLKRKQAELAIEFQEDRGYRGQRRSPEQLQRGQQIRTLISSLNGRKGVKNFVAA